MVKTRINVSDLMMLKYDIFLINQTKLTKYLQNYFFNLTCSRKTSGICRDPDDAIKVYNDAIIVERWKIDTSYFIYKRYKKYKFVSNNTENCMF